MRELDRFYDHSSHCTLVTINCCLSGSALRSALLTPFLIGGGIAFVLNVPMSFFEETLFGNKRVKEKKLDEKAWLGR